MFVRDPRTGRVVQVPDVPTGRVNPGMSAEQYNRIMSTLPDAELAGAVGPGVVPGQGAQARQGGIVRQPPPTWRPLAGSAPNNRGNTIIIEPPTLLAINDTFDLNQTVVETQRPAGEDAEVISLSLLSAPVNASDELAFPINLPTNMSCELQWGIGGANFTAVIDWGRGLCLVLPASFLRVRAFYSGILTAAPATAAPKMSFSAGFAYGYVGGQVVNSARRSVPVPALAAGATSAVIPVPAFATAFSVPSFSSADPAGAPSLLVRQFSGNGATASVLAMNVVASQTNAASQLESTFPIVDGCRAIDIQNLGASTRTPTVLWNLSL